MGRVHPAGMLLHLKMLILITSDENIRWNGKRVGKNSIINAPHFVWKQRSPPEGAKGNSLRPVGSSLYKQRDS